MKYAIGVLALAGFLQAQSGHSVTLTWADTQNPSGTTYNVYRATGLCTTGLTFSKLASAITLKTYLDSNVVPGSFCYQVTATSSGMESGPSNAATATVGSFPPTNLTISVQ